MLITMKILITLSIKETASSEALQQSIRQWLSHPCCHGDAEHHALASVYQRSADSRARSIRFPNMTVCCALWTPQPGSRECFLHALPLAHYGFKATLRLNLQLTNWKQVMWPAVSTSFRKRTNCRLVSHGGFCRCVCAATTVCFRAFSK